LKFNYATSFINKSEKKLNDHPIERTLLLCKFEQNLIQNSTETYFEDFENSSNDRKRKIDKISRVKSYYLDSKAHHDNDMNETSIEDISFEHSEDHSRLYKLHIKDE